MMGRPGLNVLVTGGTGLLGSSLVPKLLERGHSLVLLQRDPPGQLVEGAIQIPGDVSDPAITQRLRKRLHPDAIIHLAALAGVDVCEEKREEAVLTNVSGTHHMARLAADLGCRLVFASSREVYGERPIAPTPEDSEPNPKNHYGRTKMLAEEAIRRVASDADFDYLVLRITNVYGRTTKGIVSRVARQVLSGEEVTVKGGDQLLNLIHVEEVSRAFVSAVELGGSVRETVNVGSGTTVTLIDLIKKVGEVLGRHPRVVREPLPPTHTKCFVPDLTKARRLLDFEAKMELEEGLRRLQQAILGQVGDRFP